MIEHTQSVSEHIEAMHSRNGFSRARMSASAAASFDDAYHALLMAHGVGDTVSVRVRAEITWGRPRTSIPEGNPCTSP